MRKLLLLLVPALVLVACNSNEETEVESAPAEEQETVVVTKVLKDEKYDIELFSNEDLKLVLTNQKHEQSGDGDNVSEIITLTMKLQNHENKTFEYSVEDMTLDGREFGLGKVGMSMFEIEPDAELEFDITFSKEAYEVGNIAFEEHIKGTFSYQSYDGDSNSVEINEYIN